jgi:deoxyribonuclease-4
VRFGAHVSISGHIHLAVDRAAAIGCECLQIFVGNPRQWRRIEYADADVALFRQKRVRAKLDPLVAHGVYLINLASPDDEFYARSVASLIAGVEGIHRLGGLGVITHIGSRMGQPWPEAAARVVAAVHVVLESTEGAMVILENAAGAGGIIGATFEELAAILDALEWHPRVGVCLDTAHLFSSGFDIRTPEGVAGTLRVFDRIVGLRRLVAFHLNDSKSALASHLDRHENIGRGQIGLAGFRALVHHRAARRLPGFIETPGIDRRGADRRNLDALKRLRRLGPTRGRSERRS